MLRRSGTRFSASPEQLNGFLGLRALRQPFGTVWYRAVPRRCLPVIDGLAVCFVAHRKPAAAAAAAAAAATETREMCSPEAQHAAMTTTELEAERARLLDLHDKYQRRHNSKMAVVEEALRRRNKKEAKGAVLEACGVVRKDFELLLKPGAPSDPPLK